MFFQCSIKVTSTKTTVLQTPTVPGTLLCVIGEKKKVALTRERYVCVNSYFTVNWWVKKLTDNFAFCVLELFSVSGLSLFYSRE